MAFRGFRQSKYRHVFADDPKQDACWTGMRISGAAGDQQFIKASTKYFAIPLRGGGGPVGIFDIDKPEKMRPAMCPELVGHSGTVLDLDFNPFDDSMLATGGEDQLIKIWKIPDGFAEYDDKERRVLKDSLVTLEGHRKKVILTKFHPTANLVLASTSFDGPVKIWDIQKACAVSSFDEMPNQTQDIVFGVRGDNIATSCKDKNLRILDARTGSVTCTIPTAHDGIKAVKMNYEEESGKLLSFGTNRQSSREVKVWDLSNLSKPLTVQKIDNGAGCFFPLFDNDTNVLYLCGKGDGNIRIFEFEDKDPYLFKLNDGYHSTVSTRGICMVPKRGLDVMSHETARLLKVTNSHGVLPLRFYVPRKSEAFQDDIFPDCPAPISAHTADEWLAGSSKTPTTMSLNPKNRTSNLTQSKSFKLVTVQSVTKELDEAKKRIQFLEQKLKEHSIEF